MTDLRAPDDSCAQCGGEIIFGVFRQGPSTALFCSEECREGYATRMAISRPWAKCGGCHQGIQEEEDVADYYKGRPICASCVQGWDLDRDIERGNP